MFRSGKARLSLVAFRDIFSSKAVLMLFCVTLVLANATTSHAEDHIKIPGFWAAVNDFWDFLKSSEDEPKNTHTDEEHQGKDKQLIEIISDELSSSDDIEDPGLDELTNNPLCKAIYVAEFLPTYNQQAIEKCQKIIAHEEYKTLFEHYVSDLCLQTVVTELGSEQLVQIQLRLRKYSQTFPQSNFQVDIKDIDGIYGTNTCRHIAFFQIASQYQIVDGQADLRLYNYLATIVPLSESEIESALHAVRKPAKSPQSAKSEPGLTAQESRVSRVTILQKEIFCTRYSDDRHCIFDSDNSDVVELVNSER